MSTSILTILVSVIIFSEAAKIPSNFKKCNRSKPDFATCLPRAVEYALLHLNHPIKESNLPNLQPFEISKLSFELRQQKVNIAQNLTNCKVFGFTEAKIKMAEWNFDEKTVKMAGIFPEVKVDCEFTANGKLLFLAFQGEGNIHMALAEFDTVMGLQYNETKKNDKTYLKFYNPSTEVKIGDLKIKIDNLFKGEKELSERMSALINENWREIYEEIFNGVFQKLSIEEAFDN